MPFLGVEVPVTINILSNSKTLHLSLSFELWSETRETNLADIANCPVVLAGDGRNDSPGFSAKYCVYSLMDCESHKVIDVQIVDKRDVDLKSMRMEKLGLQRGMTSVRLRINVVELVTDASTSVKAMMGITFSANSQVVRLYLLVFYYTV